MANQTGDPRGPGMPGSGGWTDVGQGREGVAIADGRGDLSWCFDGVPPFGGVYVLDDDVLQVTVTIFNVNPFNLQYRILRPDGTVLVSQDSISAPASRVPFVLSRQLVEGILLSVALIPNVVIPQTTYCYASMALRRQNLGITSLHQILTAGYATQGCPLSWPGNPLQRPTDGMGILRNIVGSTPAAGADISETVPTNTRWQLLSIKATLTTSAAVANRFPQWLLDDGVNSFFLSVQDGAQAASLSALYEGADSPTPPVFGVGAVVQHIPAGIMLGSSFRIRTQTAALQAADQWTAPIYLVREWQDSV